MKVRYLIILFLLIQITACGSSSDADRSLGDLQKGKEVVLVGNTMIREGLIEFLAEINPRVEAQMKNPLARKKLIDNLVEQELLYQESVSRGLDKTKAVDQKAALYKRVIIAQALLEDDMKTRAKKYYDGKKDTEFTKVKVSHIQIDWISSENKEDKEDKEDKKDNKKPAPPTEAEKAKTLEKAKQVKARLSKGEDFAKIAEEVSDDKASKRKAGDLGLISKDDTRLTRRGLGALSTTAFTLKKGEISDPIETDKGYNIITVTSDTEQTSFEEAEKTIQMQIQKTAKDELLMELKKKTTIVFAEEEKKKEEKNDGAVENKNLNTDNAEKVSPHADQNVTDNNAAKEEAPKTLTGPDANKEKNNEADVEKE